MSYQQKEKLPSLAEMHMHSWHQKASHPDKMKKRLLELGTQLVPKELIGTQNSKGQYSTVMLLDSN